MAGAPGTQIRHTGLMDTPGSRGRLSSEHRAYVLDAHARQESVEVIARRLGRSVESIRKVLEGSSESVQVAEADPWDLDEMIDYLADLPEEAMHEVLELSRLQRRSNELRQSLSERLAGATRVAKNV